MVASQMVFDKGHSLQQSGVLAAEDQTDRSRDERRQHERNAEPAQEVVHAAHRPHDIELISDIRPNNCRSISFAGTGVFNSDRGCTIPSSNRKIAPIVKSLLPHLSVIVILVA